MTYIESCGSVELLFLPKHEPITGQDLSTLHQQERKEKSGDQDVSFSGGEVRLVDLPGDRAKAPFFVLHDRLSLFVLLLEDSDPVGALFTLAFFLRLDFTRDFIGIILLFLLLF